MSASSTLGIGGHQRARAGRTNDWLTPPEIIKRLGPFDLDPACPEGMPWRTANRMITPAEDGLAQDWNGRVWLNPPYGQETGLWLKRLAAHGNGIALVFARTETADFFDTVWERADAFLFLRARLHFYRLDGTRAPGNSGGPSVLIAYGIENFNCLANAAIPGAFLPAAHLSYGEAIR